MGKYRKRTNDNARHKFKIKQVVDVETELNLKKEKCENSE